MEKENLCSKCKLYTYHHDDQPGYREKWETCDAQAEGNYLITRNHYKCKYFVGGKKNE